ncbi:G-type lectin S-receptor-like serine/threonine-protein kinase At1g11410 [Actinidia eriantha]|uniref:G-type lectin S-receptor-like serine/threonine-protein kinase At1g11410 n=1 Tax=Actinidia eriantha TaxID=165200 RepID=UPI002582970D|nr:G-type lectin S-receptor-like serine/threonine-protein kinase At1g11410 [Actinidia eriantha]
MTHERKLVISFLILLLLQFCTPQDTITPNQSLKDGDLLVSSNDTFALGFFSPGKSRNRYLGIWYNKVTELTIVWVANRDNPINDTSGVVSIESSGNLVIHAPDRVIPVWSTNISGPAHSAKLLDSGNLVVFGGGDTKRIVVWQSFDYPTDTVIPFMKLGVDRRTGLNRFLTSWKSRDDPGIGEYSFKMDLTGSPQFFLNKGPTQIWSTGPWIGHGWSGVPAMTLKFIFTVSYVDNPNEVSLMYTIPNASIFSRMVVNEFGVLERLTWHDNDQKWVGFWSAPKDRCDHYGQCGPFGNCDPYLATSQFDCTCLPGFEPVSARDWYLGDGSGGCVRKRGGHVCGNGEGFVEVARAKVPNTWTARVESGVGLRGCEEECLRNCTCNAYASADISKEESDGGCVTWHGELVDTRVFSSGGQNLYIRADAVEVAQYLKSQQSHGKKGMVAAIVASTVAVLLITICLSSWLVMKKRKGKRGQHELIFSPNRSTSLSTTPKGNHFDESGTNAELPYFDLSTIVAATENFSFANKLGQGGFGTVYKGRLLNGQEIAVKRLAKNSGQGVEEFKNEVTLIAKLQHRNLVRLLGFCIQKEEKMLVYEYLPNKGLDSFIFDKIKGSFLDWTKRYDIVLGIARGLLYLHQDSRLRIVHRDLKASNVLLDGAMNPKISDFGMAKIFGGDQIEANTNRVVGTYGYMSPEYAMEGLFSIKSDVFSFGVLLLEIISGTKNNSYYQENSVNLIGHVWKLWEEGKALDIVDSSMGNSYPVQQLLRCIHIGLLCVQELATDRPTMSNVAFMLCNETELPPPKQPAFIFFKKTAGPDSSSASVGAVSINDLTVTMVQAR